MICFLCKTPITRVAGTARTLPNSGAPSVVAQDRIFEYRDDIIGVEHTPERCAQAAK